MKLEQFVEWYELEIEEAVDSEWWWNHIDIQIKLIEVKLNKSLC